MTYERLRPLGRGGTAEVWLARDPAGALVALKRTPDTAVARAAAGLGHPNVLPVLATDGDLLVMPYVPGGSLAAALAAGAAYAAPQAAALGAALADALAAAHAAGLVHGDVKAGNVLLAGAGTPLLADFRGTGTPEGDVRDLAALLTSLAPALASHATQPNAAALRDALRAAPFEVDGDDPHPTRDYGPRPPAAPAATQAAGAQAAGRPGSDNAAGTTASGGARYGLRTALAAAVALVVAVLAGWSLPGGSSAGALPAPPPAPTDWRATLTALDAERSAAFARADPAALNAVYTATSPALAADRRLLTDHARQGRRVADLHLVVLDVRPIGPAAPANPAASAADPDGTTAVLDVTDRLLPYTATDRAGGVVQRWAGRGPRTWRITLTRTPQGWRIASVAPAPRGVAA